jgi:hypothetical protein
MFKKNISSIVTHQKRNTNRSVYVNVYVVCTEIKRKNIGGEYFFAAPFVYFFVIYFDFDFEWNTHIVRFVL